VHPNKAPPRSPYRGRRLLARRCCAVGSLPALALGETMSSYPATLSGRILANIWLLAAVSVDARSGEWNFQVLLDGKPIGSHHFQVSAQGSETRLLSEADFKVTVLSFPFYRYHHVSQEAFQDGCLQALRASTSENGTNQEVRGSLRDSAFVVTTRLGASVLPPCVMTFDYWNPRILQQSHLLNPQTGAYLPIVVTHLGSEVLAVGGKSQLTETYLLVADAMKIKLWYSPEERWLALESPTPDGRLMRYQLR
jgi:hypothetical protein